MFVPKRRISSHHYQYAVSGNCYKAVRLKEVEGKF
jgi:hypothetical protein